MMAKSILIAHLDMMNWDLILAYCIIGSAIGRALHDLFEAER
jgi:hypothetical protein